MRNFKTTLLALIIGGLTLTSCERTELFDLTENNIVYITDTVYIDTTNQNALNSTEYFYNNEYTVGPAQVDCRDGVWYDEMWVSTEDVQTIVFNTKQHRNYDRSRIYDQHGNIIFELIDISEAATWYDREHILNIAGNDSIKIEFYVGFDRTRVNGFSNCRNQLEITEFRR